MDSPPSLSPSPSASSSEEELPYIHAKIYWDLNTCPLPPCVQEWCAIVGKVTEALRRALDFHLPIPITAYGDTVGMPRSGYATLNGCISVQPCDPTCSFESKLIPAIENWLQVTWDMSNYLIITGDSRVFSHFDDLRGRNCNILVAHPDGPPPHGLLSTVCYAWELSSLYRGEAPYHARQDMMQLTPPLPRHKPGKELPYIHTKIYWDLNTCPLPPCVEEWRTITSNVNNALTRALGFNLYVPVTAYCDTFGMSNSDFETLMSCIRAAVYCLPDWPIESKLIGDIDDWQKNAIEKMSNYLIITGDPRVFSCFNDLRWKKGNNILVAHPNGPPPHGLLSTVCYAWQLSSLYRGEAPYHARRDMMQLPPPLPCHKPRTTKIYWDLHTCPLPRGEEWSDIVKNVRLAIAEGFMYRDPIAIGKSMGITAYGDLINMPVSDYARLSNLISSLIQTDVNVSLASKITAAIQGGGEQNVMVISGEMKVFDDVEQVRRPNMNILVAHPDNVFPDLYNSRVSHAWTLSAVFHGECPYYVGPDLVGRRRLDAERAKGGEYARCHVEGVYREEVAKNPKFRMKECTFSLNTMLQMISDSKAEHQKTSLQMISDSIAKPIMPRRFEHMEDDVNRREVRRNRVARMTNNYPSLANMDDISMGDWHWLIKMNCSFLERH